MINSRLLNQGYYIEVTHLPSILWSTQGCLIKVTISRLLYRGYTLKKWDRKRQKETERERHGRDEIGKDGVIKNWESDLYLNKDETELKILSPSLSLSPFFSPSKKKRHRIKRERAVMAIKKCTELRFILNKIGWI